MGVSNATDISLLSGMKHWGTRSISFSPEVTPWICHPMIRRARGAAGDAPQALQEVILMLYLSRGDGS